MKTRFLIPVLLLVAACTTNKPMTEEQKAAVLDEGTAIVREMFGALAVSDAGKMVSLCENSDDFTFIFAGGVYNYQSMIEVINNMLPEVEKQTFDTKFERYTVIDPTCFVYNWHGRNGVYMKSGEASVEEDYLVTYAFRKHDDGWKLFNGHESSRPAMPADTAGVQ